MTNFEKIKNMSLEEMAKFIASVLYDGCNGCPAEDICMPPDDENMDPKAREMEGCGEVLPYWLNQEAEE